MTTSINSSRKRTQRDYTLAFKLGVVERVEKGEMTYKQAKPVLAFKAVQLYSFGLENMVDSIGRNLFSIPLCLSQKKPLPKRSSALNVS